MFSVTIKGFKTLEQAEAFYSWYEGQGEQGAISWFEEDPDLGMRCAMTDMSKAPEFTSDGLTFYVKITP